MERVQGMGGIFFTAEDPDGLAAWYAEHLGIGRRPDSPWGPDDPASLLRWRDLEDPDRVCSTVFAPFPADTDYFEPGTKPYMLNFRVDDLDAMLAQLEAAGIEQQGHTLVYEFGRFARIIDPEGNPLELWEPAPGF